MTASRISATPTTIACPGPDFGGRARLRVIPGSRGVPHDVVIRQTTLDDLLDELTALEAEAVELAELALPAARQLALMATALGPASGRIAQGLVELLERHERRHKPGRAA